MKNHLNALCTSRLLLNLALTLSLALPLPSLAASVALASSPLATASTSTVLPNLMFMLDDSGSMDWDYMPDDALNFHNGKYGFNSNHCNGVYYNPKITYTPPVDSTGANLTTPFSDSNGNQPFTKAETDGYNTGTTVNLNTGFTGGSGTGQSGNILTPGPAFYYTYSGTQTTGVQMDFHNTSSIFYNECISAIGLTTKVDGVNPVNTVFTKQTLATTPTTTITINTSTANATFTIAVGGGNGFTTVSSITVGGTTITSGSACTSGCNSINAETSAIAGRITLNGFSATYTTGGVITVTGPASVGAIITINKSSGNYTIIPSTITPISVVSSIKVNGVELLLSGSAAIASNTSTTATNIAAKINAAGYSATASGNVVTITGPASADGYTPVITNSGSMTYTTAQFPNITNPVQLTNFANWYTYYSTRMLMMKTGVGQAFSPISNKYRVGFMTMNNNVSPDIVEIAPFDATQKSAWYAKLYASNPGLSTPLREALSHVGQMYAHKFGDYTYYTATITVGGSGSTVVNSITVNGAETMGATSTGSTSTSTVATSVAAQINKLDPSDYGATVSSNKITITGPVSANGSVPFITNNGGGMTFTATAFTPTTVHAQLNGITPKDPVQYSCQQNFVILSTDGYWNGATTYDLSTPNQPVGNQDGTAARPMYDGGLFTKTTSLTSQKQTQITQTTSQLQKRTTQLQSSTSHLQQRTGALQWTTNLQKNTTAALKKSTATYTSTVYRLTVSTTLAGTYNNAIANTAYTCITSGTGSGTSMYCKLGAAQTSGTGLASCTVTANGSPPTGSATTDASKNVITACTQVWSTPAAVGANGTCIASATVQCSTGAGAPAYITTYPPASACVTNFNAAGNNTANGSGNVITCPVNAAFNPTWTNVAGGGSCTPDSNVNCQYNFGVWSSPSSCSTNLSSGSGAWNIISGTDCQYTAWTAYANASSCADVPQDTTSPYDMTASGGLATQCQTTDTGWVGAASCANSDTHLTNGQIVYCPNPNPVVTKTYVQNTCSTTTSSCTSPFTTSSCITTSCTTATTQPTTLVGSCIQGNSGAPNYIQTTCSTTTLSTSSNASSCTPGNSGSPSYITTTCTGGAGGTSDTLADVAMYYYQTDLRDSSLDNCTGGPSTDFPSGTDVCQNNVFINDVDKNTQQHLTTFTLGLGARGRMVYTSKDYMNDTSGDFYSVYSPNPPTLGYTLADSTKTPPICSWQANGTICNWPIPSSGSIANIDDLWHAAVNGRGTYFSATDPAALSDGLSSALSSITARKGAAAAAATSTLNPVAGNNFAYVASYTTVKWIGNLEARSINTTSGVIAQTATWCEENITADTCAAPGSVIASISGSSTVYNCVTPNSTATNCTSPSVFDPITNNCSLQMALACTGTLPTMVGPITDTRTIYTANSTGTSLINFDAAYAAANPTNFSAAHINTLSQWSALTATQQAAAAGVNLINFLRGQNGYEDRATNLVGAVDNRFYRAREAVLGDALESQPSYIGAPTFSYADTGYSAFVTAKASRPGTVYMGTNDGMLHAFNANTGIERWAYVPSMVIPNMWKLADFNYSTQHVNFVNGSPIISDFYCTVNCGGTGGAPSWRTILVGGLSGGGREYYALDITDPTAPTLLWEFTPAQDANLGYSFGLPVVTKMANGTWIVLVTSGYDNGTLSGDAVTPNSPAGNGQGYLYVLDARTGAILKKITTGVGSAITPSGLAKIAAWNNAPSSTEASYTYGGDLLGNVWRFDINALGSPLLFAILKDPSGIVQPVTTTPTLGLILGKRVIFVGTGKYLESSGITHDDLKDTQVQSLYAIKDDDATATLVNPRSYTATAPLMVQQTITPNGSVRTGSTNAVDFNVDRGWFVDFPDTGERVNIDSKLVLGALLVPTIVPSNTVCSPGGYGWLNYFDYLTGQPITNGTGLGAAGTNTNVSAKYDASIVGMNILYIAGKPVVEVVTSDNPTPTINKDVIIPPSNATFTGRRMQWRELIP